MLQYVAVCCSVLQCVAARHSVLLCVAVCCSVLQCVVFVAVRCSVLQCVHSVVSGCGSVCICVFAVRFGWRLQGVRRVLVGQVMSL